MKKYNFTRGEPIVDSSILYLKEAGYIGKHRMVLGQCEICDTIKAFRLYSITSKRTRSCGCYHKDMVKTGKLTAYSMKARSDRPWKAKAISGNRFKKTDIVFVFRENQLGLIGDLTISEIYKNIEGVRNEKV